ncbi:DUF2087 domain-containing protein [Maridesulfovibrio sp.]|uniref:DUF2087 domain-containing protein n=1 Tax=Maridesulfovibrio sp. TaxID=2795000 RepID=UPI002A188D02|nr:DUF2087 domain-containing protein [Maridesulfovibrio sp.]
MPRTPLSLNVSDVSALARNLRKGLEDYGTIPGHVEMLNLLAKAGGYRNFQHLKAVREESCKKQAAQFDQKRVKKATRYFDLDGRMNRWPKKENQRMLCLWVLWARLPARTRMTELELDEQLILNHSFCDHVLLRRWMVDNGLLTRTQDGTEYRRVEATPPAEAIALFKML